MTCARATWVPAYHLQLPTCGSTHPVSSHRGEASSCPPQSRESAAGSVRGERCLSFRAPSPLNVGTTQHRSSWALRLRLGSGDPQLSTCRHLSLLSTETRSSPLPAPRPLSLLLTSSIPMFLSPLPGRPFSRMSLLQDISPL